MSVEARVQELLSPVIATLGVELLDVEFTGGSLRLTVDEKPGITTERLAEVNRLVSPILDQHDPIPGRYTLEVSSPGLERPLRRPGHYERAVGESVVVKLVPSAEPRRVKGTLRAADATGDEGSTVEIEAVEIDGVELDEPELRRIRYGDIASARTLFEWGPSPKPGQPGAKKRKKAGRAGAANATNPSQPRGAR